jgi:hypothetical protein
LIGHGLHGRRPAIVVTLRAGAPYQRLVASAPPDAEQLVSKLEAAVAEAKSGLPRVANA